MRQLPEEVGPGNVLMLEARFEHVTEIVTGFGKLGVLGRIRSRRRAAQRMAGYLAIERLRRPLSGRPAAAALRARGRRQLHHGEAEPARANGGRHHRHYLPASASLSRSRRAGSISSPCADRALSALRGGGRGISSAHGAVANRHASDAAGADPDHALADRLGGARLPAHISILTYDQRPGYREAMQRCAGTRLVVAAGDLYATTPNRREMAACTDRARATSIRPN